MQAVAAEALLPAAPQLAAGGGGPPAAAQVRQLLWDALLELEDLSPATASVMALLAEVYTTSPATAAAGEAAAGGGGAADSSLGQLVPRLWPFLRHSLTTVRHASLQCLTALLRTCPVAALLPGEELQRALRLLFQCLLLERHAEVLAAAQAAWQLLVQRSEPAALVAALTAQPTLGALFQLAATPAHSSLDASLILTVPLPRKRATGGSSSKAQLAAAGRAASSQQLPAASESQAAAAQGRRRESLVVEADGDAASTTRMRLAAAQALGQLAHAMSASSGAANPVQPLLDGLLRGPTATGRLLASFVVTHWAQLQAGGSDGAAAAPATDPCLQHLLSVLLELLAAPAAAQQPFSELAQLYVQLRGQASGLIALAVQANMALAMPGPLDALGHQGALALAAQVPPTAGKHRGFAGIGQTGSDLPNSFACLTPWPAVPASHTPHKPTLALPSPPPSPGGDLQLATAALRATAGLLATSEAVLQTSVASAQAVAVVHLASLPPKLNTIIQPLVAAIRREPQAALQDAAAEGLARLTLLCADRTPSPNDKWVEGRGLCELLHGWMVPCSHAAPMHAIGHYLLLPRVMARPCPHLCRIIKNMCSFACGDPCAVPTAAAPPDLQTVLDGEDGGNGSAGSRNNSKAVGGKAAAPTPQEQQEELAAQALALARRGGEAVLQSMARQAGSQLQQRLPKLWELVWAPLTAVQQQVAAADLQAAVQALHMLAVLAPAVHADLAPQLATLLPLVTLCLQHANAAVQLAAARALAALAQAHTAALLPPLLRLLAPLLVGELLERQLGVSRCLRAGSCLLNASLWVAPQQIMPSAVEKHVPPLTCASTCRQCTRQCPPGCPAGPAAECVAPGPGPGALLPAGGGAAHGPHERCAAAGTGAGCPHLCGCGGTHAAGAGGWCSGGGCGRGWFSSRC